MTRNFQIIAQVAGLFLNGSLIDAIAEHWHWKATFTKVIMLIIQGVMGTLAVLAHDYNRDGSKTQQ